MNKGILRTPLKDIIPSQMFKTKPLPVHKKIMSFVNNKVTSPPDETEQDNIKPYGRQQMHHGRYLRSGLLKKSDKYRHLQQDGNSCYQENGQRIDQPFRHDCSQ